jgi:hypothetical protein
MSNVDPTAQRNLRPRALIERMRALPRAELARAVPVPLLLVRLDDLAGELAQSLEQLAETGTVRVEPGMGFHTQSIDRRTLRAPSVPPPASLAPAQIAVRVIRAVHFVVPLGKRPDADRAFSERVSVGRARNSDVVLRHPSVSKFHAWFARDDGNAYFLTDASSRNGTFRNAVALAGGDPVCLRAGDLLRFGRVEATYCDAATLRDVLDA